MDEINAEIKHILLLLKQKRVEIKLMLDSMEEWENRITAALERLNNHE